MMCQYLNPFQFILSGRPVFRRSVNLRSRKGIINLYHANHECVARPSGTHLYGVIEAEKETRSPVAQ
jgi:hypothetical protein